VVLFKDVMDEAARRVLVEINQKNPDLPEEQRREVAEAVGLGAMAYAMLAVDNTKDIVFDIEASLNFDGRTGPYIQNAHVRAASILKKSSGLPNKANFEYSLTPHEVQLIDRISRFPTAVEQAALEYRPLVMATFADELASTFHSFYHSVPVLQAESEEQRVGRLRLVAAAKQTLANALTLLGITAPEVM
jgi:arginyl-tRNA synthetase